MPSVRYVDARAISVVDKGSSLPRNRGKVMQVVQRMEIKTMKPKIERLRVARFCREPEGLSAASSCNMCCRFMLYTTNALFTHGPVHANPPSYCTLHLPLLNLKPIIVKNQTPVACPPHLMLQIMLAFAAFLLAQAAGEDGFVMPVYQSCAEAFADNEWLSSNSRSFYISNPTQMSICHPVHIPA